jgi:TBC1 domain family protein 5
MSVLKLKFINLCKNSDLENEQIRPMAWKIFFKVLPSEDNSNLKAWIIKTISDRQKFEKIRKTNHKEEYLTNNDKSINNDNKNNNFEGYDLKKLIEQDINRTFQNLKLFQDNCVKELLSNILFYWSIQPENKKMSYRQGMNDLLSILFFSFFPFYFSEKRKSNDINITNNELYPKEQQEFLFSLCKDPVKHSKSLYLFFHDEKFLSHDLFAIFSSMMSFGIKKLYETANDIQEDFLNFKAGEKQIDFVYKRALDIYHNKLRNYDQDLFTYLIKHRIDPTTFMVRWLRCLFCREFTYKVSIQLWDIIFLEEFFQSDNNLQFIDYLSIAMYENIRDEMMVGQEEEILKLLFRYPQIESPKNLIKNAYKIRSFFEFNQYQKNGIKADYSKEVKINLNKDNGNNFSKNNNYNINKKEIKMTKKEQEIYDFDKRDINQKPKEINNINKAIMNINNETDFKISYTQIPHNKEGELLKNMALLSRLKNLEKKYGKKLQKEDQDDLRFIISELYSRLKIK